MSEDRVLPHNLDAERWVLGAILTHQDAIYAVGGTLTPDHFFRDAHRRVYAALLTLAEKSIARDFVTLAEELRRRGDLDEVGGPAFVGMLANDVPRATNVQYYANIVREKAALRAIITASNRVTDAAYAAQDDAAIVLDEAERGLIAISDQAIGGDLILADQLLPATMAMLEQIAHTRRPVTGLATGLGELDVYTRGLHPGNLIVVGGRPGEGKSALALQMALHAARETPVAFFSMEMNRDEILTRAIAQEARVDHHLMMQGRLSDVDQRTVGEARNTIEALPIAFDDTSSQTPFQIRSKAKKLQARKGLGLVVVDYLQLLQRPRTAHSREEAVAENTWALKVLAGELKVPVVALSQLNRESAKGGTRPTLTDLRESGAVEQHANVVLLLYRPPQPESYAGLPPVELIIAKQRNGPQGVHVDYVFKGAWMRFETVDRWRGAA